MSQESTPVVSLSLIIIRITLPLSHSLSARSKWTHELVGGAAGFAAMREYEKHEAANGKPANHALAKELLAGFAAAGKCPLPPSRTAVC